MPKPPLPASVEEFLTQPHPAVMATVGPGGQPVSVATWYLWDHGRVLLNLDAGRKRLEHLRADPRISLTVLDREGWYTHVSLQGRVVTIDDDTTLADIDRLSRHYTGAPYSVRDRPRVTAIVEVDRWHGWGAMKNAH